MKQEGKEYKNLLALFGEKIQNPVMILDEDRVIRYVNDDMRATFGGIEGHNASILFTNDPNAGYEETVEKYRGAGGRTEANIADVDYRLIETEIEDGGRKYLVVMLEDISEKKHLETLAATHLKRYQTDTEMASLIQKSMLPGDGRYWDLMQLSSVYLPAEELSGDAYDIMRIGRDEALVYIADVAGHGIQASLLTIFINEKIRAHAETASCGLDLLLGEILAGFKAFEIDARVYMSVLCCRYNRSRGELALANAGHNCYPLILRGNGRTEEVPVRGMPISAISDVSSYNEEIIGISPGDRLILYTDGLIEEYSKTEKSVFGPEGMRRSAEEGADLGCGALATHIVNEAARYTMVSAKDDRTLVIAEML
jgi:sigma-B regulation protein RsbU (phosphoserine phosphatase)